MAMQMGPFQRTAGWPTVWSAATDRGSSKIWSEFAREKERERERVSGIESELETKGRTKNDIATWALSGLPAKFF